MNVVKAVATSISGAIDGYRFKCPGCEVHHVVYVGRPTGPNWTFNGDLIKPTFSPSVLVRYNGEDHDTEEGLPAVCHSFVRDGQIQFLSDCTHRLAGQTVPLPPIG